MAHWFKILLVTFPLLALAACDDGKTPTSPAVGNLTAKAESLSAQNDADIRADLTALNAIINPANSKAVAFKDALLRAGQRGDKAAMNSLMQQSKALLETTNQSLTALNMKSREVQEVRINILQGNMLAIKLHDFYLNGDLSAESQKEISRLQKQSITLLQSVGARLDALNAQYNPPS